MRSRFDEQLKLLNRKMTEMGGECESIIAAAGKALLAKMQHSATLPTVTRMADVKALSPEGQALFRLESRCTDLYALGAKKPLPGGTEQRLQIVST